MTLPHSSKLTPESDMTPDRNAPGPGITIYGDGTYVARDAAGVETLRIDAPPPEQRHALGFGACDCCERLPAGTVRSVLALLDDDHPAARLLREATSDD